MVPARTGKERAIVVIAQTPKDIARLVDSEHIETILRIGNTSTGVIDPVLPGNITVIAPAIERVKEADPFFSPTFLEQADGIYLEIPPEVAAPIQLEMTLP